MMAPSRKFKDVKEYLAAFPPEIRSRLKELRALIKKTAPAAKERISYNIPAYFLDGKMVIYFAGYRNHVGIYPGAAAIIAFKAKLKGYKTARGTVQFPHAKKIPVKLVKDIVRYRIAALKAG